MENIPEVWDRMLDQIQNALAVCAPGTAACSRLLHEQESLSIARALCTGQEPPLRADLAFALPRIAARRERAQKRQAACARQGKNDPHLDAEAAALANAQQQLTQALAQAPSSWLDGVVTRMRRKDQILFAPDSPLLQDLATALAGQSRRAVTLWALEQAGRVALQLAEKYPDLSCPMDAVAAARAWAAGQIRMPQAKRAILACHAMAKDLPEDPAAAARCHAVAQGCSTVHTTGHALGLPIYEMTALVYEQGVPGCRAAAEAQAAAYRQRLFYWQQQAPASPGPWAPFLQ